MSPHVCVGVLLVGCVLFVQQAALGLSLFVCVDQPWSAYGSVLAGGCPALVLATSCLPPCCHGCCVTKGGPRSVQLGCLRGRADARCWCVLFGLAGGVEGVWGRRV
jgi:hypothetical protein